MAVSAVSIPVTLADAFQHLLIEGNDFRVVVIGFVLRLREISDRASMDWNGPELCSGLPFLLLKRVFMPIFWAATSSSVTSLTNSTSHGSLSIAAQILA